jgi:hypothetical protein
VAVAAVTAADIPDMYFIDHNIFIIFLSATREGHV